MTMNSMEYEGVKDKIMEKIRSRSWEARYFNGIIYSIDIETTKN